VELHYFYVAPGPGKNFYAAPSPAALALAPTLLNSKQKNFKGIKVNIRADILFTSDSGNAN
jgi:hypothetical protein